MCKILLFVPFEEKNEAKILDAKYDANLKCWYCSDDKKECIDRWSRRYLKNIEYDRREEYKKLNCKWDAEKKKWFTFNSNKSI